MTLIPVADTKCVCRNCKKEFIIPKEQIFEDYRQCIFCGSLKWDYLEEDPIEPEVRNAMNYLEKNWSDENVEYMACDKFGEDLVRAAIISIEKGF